jgi:uncharacterized protein
MKIRSITCFIHPDKIADYTLDNLAAKAEKLSGQFQQAGWDVQSKRMATVPFGHYTTRKNAVERIMALEEKAARLGFDYLSVGPARLMQQEDFRLIPEILSATQNVFATGLMTHPHNGISVRAVRDCAEIITKIAPVTTDGFTNLRFCAMSGVAPFTPFFPAAYSYGNSPAFSLAIECADAAVEAFKKARSVAQGRANLLEALDSAAGTLQTIIEEAHLQWEMPFKGFDFSLAPFPEDWCSLAGAIEALGVGRIGLMGSLSAAAILAETLDWGAWRHVGFNGLMLPVLEDSVLAQRSVEGSYGVKDLLMYSAVCGTGLDTVPLPGDTSAEAIAALLMDVASLSLRLRKPLTARLMPVPGMKAGEMTAYDFAFFRNGKILDFPAEKLGGALSKSDWIEIRSRS